MKHQIIVGNIGTVYDGTDKIQAREAYREYVKQSKEGYGRAAGEKVIWMRDYNIYKEHEVKAKFPGVRQIQSLLMALKKDIGDGYRVEGQEDDTPTMQVTVGASGKSVMDWSYQTGDTQYQGGAYGYAHWGIAHLTRKSDTTALARGIIEELNESFHS